MNSDIKYNGGENAEEYVLPRFCEKCGSNKIAARVLYDNKVVRYVCLSCNYSRSLPKERNLKKRTNSSLHSWADNVKARDKKCFVCGSAQNLEAHHIIPVAVSKEYMYIPTNGITLCRKCHMLVHGKEKENEENPDVV